MKRPDDVASRVRALGPWFHNMDLAGVETAPDHFLGDYPRTVWRMLAPALPDDLSGRSVLDIGCNAGVFSLELKRRGADRVLGVDSDPRYLAQARLAAEVSGLDVELRELTVYDVAALGERFDVVLFMGVLYHLRHPLLALDMLYEHAVRHTLVFQSMLRGSRAAAVVAADYGFEDEEQFEDSRYPRLYFIEHAYAGDPTNWWIPNRACAEALLRSAGFEIAEQAEEEVFICRRLERDARPPLHDEELPWSKR